MELKEYKLGELLDVTRGTTLSGEFYATEGEHIRLTLGHFDYINGGFKKNTSKDNLYFTGTVREEFILNEGDIITPLTEQTFGLIGSTAMIPESGKYIQSQDVGLIKCNTDLLLPEFCYYLLPTKLVKDQLSAGAQQTSIRHTSPDKIKACKVFIPGVEEQRRIASLLSAIDHKIEVNRAINQNLDAMAKQLYDYWFMQFDFPNEEGKAYRSNGGKMIWNEKLKREIPECWESATIESFLIIKNGKDHKHLEDGDYPVYGSGGLMRKVSQKLYEGESVLMPRKGTLNNIMYVNEAFWTVDTMFYSQMRIQQCAKYVYYAIKDYDFTRWDSGTGVPSMTSSTLYSLAVVKPDEKVLKLFDEKISPLFAAIKQHKTEIENLIRQRDELLPLLMNGQVSVTQLNSDLSAC